MPNYNARRWALSLIDDFHDLLFVTGKLTARGIQQLYSLTKREIDYHVVMNILRRSVKQNRLVASHKNGLIYYHLPNESKASLQALDNWLEQDEREEWTIIVFDIPESRKEDRNILRYYLKRLDFFALQKSVWATNQRITRSDLKIIDELKVHNYVLIFSADSIINFMGKRQVQEIFRLKEMNHKYLKLLQELVELVKRWEKAKYKDEITRHQTLKFIYRLGLRRYQRIRSGDPRLPEKILPKPWHGKRVEAILEDLKSDL